MSQYSSFRSSHGGYGSSGGSGGGGGGGGSGAYGRSRGSRGSRGGHYRGTRPSTGSYSSHSRHSSQSYRRGQYYHRYQSGDDSHWDSSRHRSRHSRSKDRSNSPDELSCDPAVVNSIVRRIKASGLFDKIRRDSLASIEMLQSYSMLKDRVQVQTSKLLHHTQWTPALDKDELKLSVRDQMVNNRVIRDHIEELLREVLEQKVRSHFQPDIRDTVAEYLGYQVEQPQRADSTERTIPPLIPPSEEETLEKAGVQRPDELVQEPSVPEPSSLVDVEQEKTPTVPSSVVPSVVPSAVAPPVSQPVGSTEQQQANTDGSTTAPAFPPEFVQMMTQLWPAFVEMQQQAATTSTQSTVPSCSTAGDVSVGKLERSEPTEKDEKSYDSEAKSYDTTTPMDMEMEMEEVVEEKVKTEEAVEETMTNKSLWRPVVGVVEEVKPLQADLDRKSTADGEEPNFSWKADLSDLSVSSVHTSDLTDYEGEPVAESHRSGTARKSRSKRKAKTSQQLDSSDEEQPRHRRKKSKSKSRSRRSRHRPRSKRRSSSMSCSSTSPAPPVDSTEPMDMEIDDDDDDDHNDDDDDDDHEPKAASHHRDSSSSVDGESLEAQDRHRRRQQRRKQRHYDGQSEVKPVQSAFQTPLPYKRPTPVKFSQDSQSESPAFNPTGNPSDIAAALSIFSTAGPKKTRKLWRPFHSPYAGGDKNRKENEGAGSGDQPTSDGSSLHPPARYGDDELHKARSSYSGGRHRQRKY